MEKQQRQIKRQIQYKNMMKILVDSASNADAERPWKAAESLRVGGLLESKDPLRRSGLAGVGSPSTALDGVVRSGTVSLSGRRAMRVGREETDAMLVVVMTDGRRTLSVMATAGGTTRCEVVNSAGPLDSLPAVEQSLMLDRLRRSICSVQINTVYLCGLVQ